MRGQRTDLFATPIWTYELDHLRPHLPAMIDEANRYIDTNPDPNNELFEQSAAILQRSEVEGWRLFYEFIATEMRSIVENDMTPRYAISEAFMRSWALRIRSTDQFLDQSSTLEVLHSHLPSLLSSVVYLQVPDELVDADFGGTAFRDPLAPLTRQTRNPGHHVPARPLRLAIFPSYLEHAPEHAPSHRTYSVPRIVVSTDLRLEIA